jgi:hypothetical protein
MKGVGSMNIMPNRNVLAMNNPSGWRFNISTAHINQRMGAKMSLFEQQFREPQLGVTLSGSSTKISRVHKPTSGVPLA